jgi:putative endonuclease
MIYYVYAIRSYKDRRVYVGMTNNVDRRFLEHNRGFVRSTKSFRPWKLIFCKNVGTSRVVARKFEKYYKSGCGKEILKNIPL